MNQEPSKVLDRVVSDVETKKKTERVECVWCQEQSASNLHFYSLQDTLFNLQFGLLHSAGKTCSSSLLTLASLVRFHDPTSQLVHPVQKP